MKIDDDVLVDPYKLRILSKTLHNNLKVNELACKVQAKSPVNRDKDSKWSLQQMVQHMCSDLNKLMIMF